MTVEELAKWVTSVKVLAGLVVGAFITGGAGYVAWGAVAKKSAVDASLAAVNDKLTEFDKVHAAEGAKIDALSSKLDDVQQDVRETRNLIESWAKPPARR